MLFRSGAVQDRLAWPAPAVPVRPEGMPGTVRGVAAEDSAELAPVPAAFVAATRKT